MKTFSGKWTRSARSNHHDNFIRLSKFVLSLLSTDRCVREEDSGL